MNTKLIAVIFLSTASSARAQLAPAHEAVLELKVETADVVVRGTVQDVHRREAGQFQEVTVTVKVLEAIKGENRSSIEFTDSEINPSNGYSIFKEGYFNSWRTGGYEFLWFLRKPGAGESSFSPFRDALSIVPQIALVRDVLPLTPRGYSSIFPQAYVTADLRVLRNPEDILAAVRTAAAYKPRRRSECAGAIVRTTPGCAVGVPYRMVVRPGDGFVQYLHLPVDERMEALCLRMIQKPEELWTIPSANTYASYVPPDAEKLPLVREQGVHCLRSFRSDATIALLKSVANEKAAPPPQNNRLPHFDPVKAAFDTLISWGISVQ